MYVLHTFEVAFEHIWKSTTSKRQLQLERIKLISNTHSCLQTYTDLATHKRRGKNTKTKQNSSTSALQIKTRFTNRYSRFWNHRFPFEKKSAFFCPVFAGVLKSKSIQAVDPVRGFRESKCHVASEVIYSLRENGRIYRDSLVPNSQILAFPKCMYTFFVTDRAEGDLKCNVKMSCAMIR